FAERGVLRAETLRFGDELRTPESLGLPEADEPPKQRLAAMTRAVEALAAEEVDPAELEDDRDERLRRLAEEKRARGEDVVEAPADAEPEEPEAGEVIDLMALLKRRLGGASRDGAARPAREGGKRSTRAGDDREGPARAAGDGEAREPAARERRPRRKPAPRKQPARAGRAARELEGATKQELYERAQALDIPGRSRMSRDELLASLRRAG